MPKRGGIGPTLELGSETSNTFTMHGHWTTPCKSDSMQLQQPKPKEHGNSPSLPASPRLCSHSPRCQHPIPRQRHGLHIGLRRLLLCEPKAKSQAGGYQNLSTHPAKLPPGQSPPTNGPIHVLCLMIGPVVASAAEAQVAATFMNAQDACSIHQTLIELGHPQPPTVIRTDNKCAEGILNNTIKQRRSKAIDMRFYWLRDRARQGQFQIIWGQHQKSRGLFYEALLPSAPQSNAPNLPPRDKHLANRISAHQHPSLLCEVC